MKVNSNDWGQGWPLTVDRGDLRHRAGAVTFRAPGGRLYAVNGTARARFPNLPPIRDIWADDPTHPGFKIDIGPLIARAVGQPRSRRHGASTST